MLDRLVESRDNSGENRRKTGLLLTTFVLMSALMVGGWVYSLYGKDFGMSDDLELSTLVAPVPVAEEEPPEPEPDEPEKQQQAEKQVDMTVRKENILNIMETPKVPDKPSTEKPTSKERPTNQSFLVDPNAAEVTRTGNPGPARTGDGGGGGGSEGIKAPTVAENPPPPVTPDAPPPPPPPPPKPKVPKVISGGVVNGKAINLPKPSYPPAARAIGAKGAVNVAVKIDENGNVVSASATSGHPLLRAAAVSAARGAKFAPTKLSGEPVSVTGVIVYNFSP